MKIKYLVTIILSFLSIYAFQNCSTSYSKNQSIELIKKLNGEWTLKSIEGLDARATFKGEIPSIYFDTKKLLIHGNSGCNFYNGSFSIDKDNFSTGPLASTRKACMEENKETEFLKLLNNPSTIKLNDNILQIIQKDNIVLEFILSTK